MEDLKKKVQSLCELKDTLITAAKEQFNQGVQSVNTHEMSEVIDMIKDLCEAEEKVAKACYYKKVVEAMHEEKEEEELMARMGGGRMGYDHWRYSSGRYAPTGHGHRSGYHHPSDVEIEGWMREDAFGDDPMKHGYRGSGSRSGEHRSRSGYGTDGSSYDSRNGSMDHNGRMGYPRSERGDRYERWHQARMGYHESKDAAHKEHMDASAREYVVDVAESMKEIWRDADPAMRKELKNKLVALTGEMN